MRGYFAAIRIPLLLLWVVVAGLTLGQGEPSTDRAEPGPTPSNNTSEQPSAAEAPADGSPASVSQSAATSLGLPPGSDVAIIDVTGMIYGFTLDSLERRVDRALNDGASVIVLEIDTNGGYVADAMEIAKYIKTIPVPTIAWVNNKAYSAGILIASAANQIVMAPAAATGDCAPIVPGQSMAPTERAKQLSPLLAEFRGNAQANGYNYTLFHAMCVLGIEVYQIEHVETGRQILVNQADYAVMVNGRSPDAVAPSGLSQNGGSGPTIVTPDSTGRGGSGSSSAGTSASGDGGVDMDVARATLQTATPQDQGLWRLVDQVHDGQTLLTLTNTQAEDVGLSAATIASENELRQFLGANSITRVSQTWSEDLAGFLASTWVRVLLVVALLLGVYLEFQSPGLGVPGAIAALAFVGLFGMPLIIGLAEAWHILLFLVGLALLIVELAFTPTFGILGLAGMAMMFVGVVLAAVPTGNGALPGTVMTHELVSSFVATVVGVILSMIGFYFLTKYFGKIPGLSRLVLDNAAPLRIPGTEAVPAGGPTVPVSGDDRLGGGRVQVGQIGRVSGTGLRPTGRVEIDGEGVDAVSEGAFIDPGTPIKVTEVHGNRIVVAET